MKSMRRIGVSVAVAAMAWGGLARAAVLDQIPDSATIVVEIKNVDELNNKVAKFADMIGLTATEPDMKDPLGSFEQNVGITDKGVNKSSDAAMATFFPGTAGIPENDVPQVMLIIPVSDYQAFLQNFKETKDDGGGITEGKPAHGGETVFIAHWGQYAAMAPAKELLAKPPTGIKLTGTAADELKKDMMLYVNVDSIRAVNLPRLKNHRDELLKEMARMQNDLPSAQMKNIFKAFDNLGLDEYQEVLEETKYAVVSANLTDDGIALSAATEFVPDSKLGKLAAACKATDQPLLAGLPDHKYFVLLGLMNSPELKAQFQQTILDPIAKAADAGGADTKSISAFVKAAIEQWNNVDAVAAGLAVPAQLGKDGLIENVQVATGDASKLKKGYTTALDSGNDLFKQAIPQGQGGVTFTVKPGAATVDDVQLDQFKVKIDTGPNGPPPMEFQMFMNTVFGSSGPGGWLATVNDKTLLQLTGVDDQSPLMADAVASAKTGKDVLSDGKGLQATAALLPKTRMAEGFVYVDEMIGTGVRMAQMFGAPVRIHVPADLPPVGITLGGDGSSVLHANVIVPTPLIQAMVGVFTDLNADMHNGGGGGPNGPGGGL